MSELLRVLRSQTRLEALKQHNRGGEFVAAQRFADATSGTQAFDAVVVNPSGNDTSALITTSVTGGGSGQLDVTNQASVDTAGTAFPVQEKGRTSGGLSLTVESGGTYSATGTTLPRLIPGSTRLSGQPSPATGGAPMTDTRILDPGDGLRYTVTNTSGNTVSYDMAVDIIELDE